MRSSLSAREIGVLELLADGLSNEEIATLLRISTETVKIHIKRIAAKLGVSGRSNVRAACVAVAFRIGAIK